MKFAAYLFLAVLATSTAKALDAVRPIPVVDHVDLIELNHYYDGDGKLVLTQWVFWSWEPSEADMVVVDWRLAKGPWEAHWHAESEEWRLILWDNETLRSVRARGRGAFMESWTQFDPELTAREKRPHDQRRKLTCPPKPDRSVLRRSSPAAP